MKAGRIVANYNKNGAIIVAEVTSHGRRIGGSEKSLPIPGDCGGACWLACCCRGQSGIMVYGLWFLIVSHCISAQALVGRTTLRFCDCNQSCVEALTATTRSSTSSSISFSRWGSCLIIAPPGVHNCQATRAIRVSANFVAIIGESSYNYYIRLIKKSGLRGLKTLFQLTHVI